MRRDQIYQLPLPEFLNLYLDTPYYYSEELANLQESMKREKAEGKKEEEKRRKAFMRTDQRTLVAKMLINRAEVEERLNIVLPAEAYGMPSGSSGDASTGITAVVENEVDHDSGTVDSEVNEQQRPDDEVADGDNHWQDVTEHQSRPHSSEDSDLL